MLRGAGAERLAVEQWGAGLPTVQMRNDTGIGTERVRRIEKLVEELEGRSLSGWTIDGGVLECAARAALATASVNTPSKRTRLWKTGCLTRIMAFMIVPS